MAEEIGHALLRAGLLKKPQLEELSVRAKRSNHTLAEQIVLDNALDDEAITDFYCKKFMVPRIPDQELNRFSKKAVDAIPVDMAQELRVIPMSVDKEKTMMLLMSDPANYQTVEEVAFHTHNYVVRAVATQKQVAWCLNHYYDIETELFHSLPTLKQKRENEELSRPDNGTSRDDPASESQTKGPSNKVIVDLHTSDSPRSHNNTISGQIAVLTPMPPSDDLENVHRSKKDSITLMVGGGTEDEDSSINIADLANHVEVATQSVVSALREIDGAETKDAIIEAALKYIATSFESALFMVTQKQKVKAWMTVSNGISSRPKAEIPLAENSPFYDVVTTRLPYSGEIYDEGSLDFLKTVLNASKNHFLLLPVTANGKVIGILAAYHALNEPSSEHLAVVLNATSGALKNLILKKRDAMATQGS